MSPGARNALLASLALLCVGIASFATALWLTLAPNTTSAPAPSALGGPFTLTDQDGRRVDETYLNGRTNLLFFGFTHCPDVCPTKLFEIAQVMQALGPAADRLNVVMVSVDPERDTPDVLRQYLASFDPRFRGLTGSVEEVARMARNWRAYYRKVPQENGYTVDHSAVVYLVDGQGRFVSTLDVTDPARAAASLRARL